MSEITDKLGITDADMDAALAAYKQAFEIIVGHPFEINHDYLRSDFAVQVLAWKLAQDDPASPVTGPTYDEVFNAGVAAAAKAAGEVRR